MDLGAGKCCNPASVLISLCFGIDGSHRMFVGLEYRANLLLFLEIISSRLKLGNEIGEGGWAGNHGAPIKNNAKFRESRRHFLSRNSARTSGTWPRLKSN